MSENAESTTYHQPTLFAADSLASLTVLPGSEEARQMTVTSGRNIAGLLASADPIGCLLKMCLVSEQPYSTRCYLTWMIWDTPQGHLLFRLAPSMPRIGAKEYSLLHTPTAQPFGSNEMMRKRGMDLIQEALMFPTPKVARGGYQNSHGKKAYTLAGMAETGMWPTPRNNSGPSIDKKHLSLDGAVQLWATPSARDWKSGKASQETMERNSRPLSEQIGGQLNPRWVEWLMGFPDGWTDLEASAMP